MTDGTDVRRAIDGPDVDHDELIEFIGLRNDEDSQRASSAGESRQKIGAYLEETGMNGKALSWLRQILKTFKKASGQEKAMDIIRSLETALPMVKAEVAGQSTPDMFDGGSVGADEEPVDPEPTEGGELEEELEQFNADVDSNVKPINFGGQA